MDTDVLARVLTVEEVKRKMKDISRAVLHQRGVVHYGERGRDEMVIVSARTWEEVTARKQAEIAGSESSADPYAAFSRALEEGRLGSGSDIPEARRRMPGLRDESDLSVTEMATLAGPDEAPKRRRAQR